MHKNIILTSIFIFYCTNLVYGVSLKSTFLGVANNTNTSQVAQWNVKLVPLDPPTISSGGQFPSSIAIDPSGNFIYVANNGSSTLTAFSVNTNSATNPGMLTLSGNPVQIGSDPWSIAVAPTGQYLDTSTSDGISQYKINKITGSLELDKKFKVKATSRNTGLVFNPNNKGLYLSNADKGEVHWFTTDKNGAIQSDQQTISAQQGAFDMVTDSLGKNLYVANYEYNINSISMYSIGTSGKLSNLTPARVSTGFTNCGLAIAPSGNYVYTTNFFANSISILNRSLATGVLSLPMTPISSVPTPTLMAVDPTGRYLVVTSNGSSQLGMYTLDQNTGTPTNSITIPSGSNSAGVAIDPTGNFVYVLNNIDNTISMYRIVQNVTLVGPQGGQYVANGERMIFTNNSGASVNIAKITTSAGVQVQPEPIKDTCTGHNIPDNGTCSFIANVPNYYSTPTLISMIIKYFPGGSASFPIYVSYLPVM